MIIGWGTNSRVYPIPYNSEQVILCKYSYFSLLLFFPIALTRSWYISDLSQLASKKITKTEAEKILNRKITLGPGLWAQFGLFFLILFVVSLGLLGFLNKSAKNIHSNQNSISSNNSIIDMSDNKAMYFPDYKMRYEKNKQKIMEQTEYKTLTVDQYYHIALQVKERAVLNKQNNTKSLKYGDQKYFIVSVENKDGKEIINNLELQNQKP